MTRAWWMAVVIGLLTASSAMSSAEAQTTYYVRSGGSALADGLTPETALASPTAAASRLRAGDTLVVGAGVYRGQVRLSASGTDAAPIRLIADTTGERTGDAGAVVLESTGSGGLIIERRAHVEVEGFVVDGQGFPRGVFIDRAADIEFRGVTVRNARIGIQIGRESSVLLERCTIEDATADGVRMSGSGTTIRGGVIRRCGGVGVSARRAPRGMRTSLVMDGVRVTESGTGVENQNELVTIVNSQFDNIGGAAVHSKDGGSELVVWNSVFYRNGSGCVVLAGAADIGNSLFVEHSGTALFAQNTDRVTANTNAFWQNATDVDRRVETVGIDLVVDPMVLDWESFYLDPQSPLIDAGVEPPISLLADTNGTARPIDAAYDIGRVEQRRGEFAASLPYANDFESDVGAEWSDRRVSSSQDYSRFLGRHGRERRTIEGQRRWVNSEATLSVRTVPGERYYMVFDLLVIDSWDGGNQRWGPDGFEMLVDGTRFRYGFLSRHAGWLGVVEEGMSASGRRGFSRWDDGALRSATFEFVASGSVTRLTWRGLPSQTISDESWGLDNVEVFHESLAEERLPIFTDMTQALGFAVMSTDTASWPSSAHWFDADGDGDLDALLGGRWGKLLLWDGAMFNERWGTAISLPFGQAIVDVENDGDLDIAYLRDGRGHEGVLINPGDGMFTELDKEAMGLSWPQGGESVFAADLDRDGWVDLLFPAANGNWAAFNEPGASSDPDEVVREFDERTDMVLGLHAPGSYGDGHFASSADANDDGQLDFFIHYSGGIAFTSDVESGSWSDSRGSPAVATGAGSRTGSSWADYDNDGDLDLWVGSRSRGERGRLYRNTPAGFVDVAASAGLADTSMHTGAAWGDIDHDGDLDLYIATIGAENVLYENLGDGTFASIDRGAAIYGNSHDPVFGDYDGDGDLDLAVTAQRVSASLLRNDTDDGRSIRVRVQGAGAGGTNAAGVGVRIDLRDRSGRFLQRRDLGLARGFGGTEPLEAHFGGVEDGERYVLWVYFSGGVQRVPFVAGAVSSEIGGNTIDGLLLVVETDLMPVRQVVRWGEMSAEEAALAREGRGLMERGPTLRRAGGLRLERMADGLRDEGLDDEAINRLGRRDRP